MSQTRSTQTNGDDTGGLAALSGRADRGLARLGARSVRYVRLVVDAAAVHSGGERAPLHVGLAVDRSGSMEGERLALAKEAVKASLRLLSAADHVALVWFDHAVQPMVTPAQPATPERIAETLRAVDGVRTGGSTALFAGWQAAAQAVATALPPGSFGRCLLITDGQANVGPQSPAALAAHARELFRRSRVVTSALGVGDGYNDELLRAITAACDGQAFHASVPSEIPAIVAREIGDALTVAARRVELQVRPSDGVRVDVLGQLRSHWAGRHLSIAIGDMVADQRIEVILALRLPAGGASNPSIEVTAWSDGEPCVLPPVQLDWTFADHARNDIQPRDVEVDRAVAEAYAARARTRAGELAIMDPPGAGKELRETAARIAGYAGSDPALRQLVQELEDEAGRVEQGVDELQRKCMTMSAHLTSRGRARDGSVKKRV